MRRLGPDPVITISSQCFTGHGLVSEIETGTPRDGRKSKKYTILFTISQHSDGLSS